MSSFTFHRFKMDNLWMAYYLLLIHLCDKVCEWFDEIVHDEQQLNHLELFNYTWNVLISIIYFSCGNIIPLLFYAYEHWINGFACGRQRFYIFVYCVRRDVVISNVVTGWTKTNSTKRYVIDEIHTLVRGSSANKSRLCGFTMVTLQVTTS